MSDAPFARQNRAAYRVLRQVVRASGRSSSVTMLTELGFSFGGCGRRRGNSVWIPVIVREQILPRLAEFWLGRGPEEFLR